MEFLAANCRCALKAKLACSVGKQDFLLIAELKGHEHVANAVIVVRLLLYLFLTPSDHLTWKWHPNKFCTRFLYVSYGSITLFLL